MDHSLSLKIPFQVYKERRALKEKKSLTQETLISDDPPVDKEEDVDKEGDVDKEEDVDKEGRLLPIGFAGPVLEVREETPLPGEMP